MHKSTRDNFIVSSVSPGIACLFTRDSLPEPTLSSELPLELLLLLSFLVVETVVTVDAWTSSLDFSDINPSQYYQRSIWEKITTDLHSHASTHVSGSQTGKSRSMGKIIIIRHGNRLDFLDPYWINGPNLLTKDSKNSPLSECGVLQAKEVASFISANYEKGNIKVCDQLHFLRFLSLVFI